MQANSVSCIMALPPLFLSYRNPLAGCVRSEPLNSLSGLEPVAELAAAHTMMGEGVI